MKIVVVLHRESETWAWIKCAYCWRVVEFGSDGFTARCTCGAEYRAQGVTAEYLESAPARVLKLRGQ